ncbi:MAG: glycoside hydrolase family 99-like domain-containing protein [Bacteroidota bacterium]|nr:glycoside hydrolase family 99-like domain-containing protein [Bacteroidota bacterium]
MSIRPLAFYLPQFHPIPENDQWWGKGFTEWTNVTKAKPLFKGHWQPRLPADLGFYDLRVSEVREAQAMLAKEYGIYGFCYWHYWFAGKRIIERPFMEMVESRKPDFPFCIAWANQSWTGTWHGLSQNQTLLEQTYPGEEDDRKHFYSLLDAFSDDRYIEVNDKKLVFIFRPMEIPAPKQFIELWQELAIKEGLKGFHFVGMHMPFDWQSAEYGYNASIPGFFAQNNYKINKGNKQNPLFEKLKQGFKQKGINKEPLIASYEKYVNRYPELPLNSHQYPWIMTDWDNTPRAGEEGWLFDGSTPELFGQLCTKAFRATENKNEEEKIVILRSWNEWAEGNYLEPDQKFGTAYLEQLIKALQTYKQHLTGTSIITN